MIDDHAKECVLAYPNRSPDGNCAAWLFWILYGDRVRYRPGWWGANVDAEEFRGKHVVVVGLNWKRAVIESIESVALSLTVLDHHEAAMADLEGLDYCQLDVTRSGARMAWDWLMVNGFPLVDRDGYASQRLRDAETIVNYVQDRMHWGFKLPKSKAVNAVIRLAGSDFMEWEQIRKADINKVIEDGEVLLKQDRAIVDQHVRHAVMINVAGHVVPCVNATVLHSDVAGRLSHGMAFGVAYFDKEDGRAWSLRSGPGGVDVADVAAMFGGGGTPHCRWILDRGRVHVRSRGSNDMKPVVIGFVVIQKGPHRYLITWRLGDPNSMEDAIKAVGEWANDPELPFTWFDAAAMCGRIKMAMQAI